MITFTNIMGLLIVMVGLATFYVDIKLAKKYPGQRWIRIPRGLAALAVAVVFFLNVTGIIVDTNGISVPPLYGRIAMFFLLTSILSGAIYSLRGDSLT